MPKRKIQYVEFKLARPRWDALRAATRKLRRVLGEDAPTLEELIAYQLSQRDARLVANEYLARLGGRKASAVVQKNSINEREFS